MGDAFTDAREVFDDDGLDRAAEGARALNTVLQMVDAEPLVTYERGVYRLGGAILSNDAAGKLFGVASVIHKLARDRDDAEALHRSEAEALEAARDEIRRDRERAAATVESADPMGEAEALGREVGALVDAKDKAYGQAFDKGGAYLRLLFPEGVPPDRYDDMLALVRDFDKSMRIATQPEAFGEDPWADKAGYALLATRCRRRRQQGAAQAAPKAGE